MEAYPVRCPRPVTFRRLLTGLVLVPVAALALGSAAPAFAERIGVSSAVNPGALSTPPSASQRTLLVGQDVFFNEVINTDATGQVQVLFLDRSALSVGPNS